LEVVIVVPVALEVVVEEEELLELEMKMILYALLFFVSWRWMPFEKNLDFERI
jgi:hypothetical protein